MTIRLMQTYLPKERSAEGKERVRKALAWLKAAKPRTNEDRTYRLLGLKWAGADKKDIQAAARAIVATQRPDGGWAQTPTPSAGQGYERSDPYATGQALYALNIGGGLPTSSDSYRRGVRYLLRTQDEDGSWFVNKRALPVNTYLDAGFPHGESQYISYGGSCWATMALMLAASLRHRLPQKSPKRIKNRRASIRKSWLNPAGKPDREKGSAIRHSLFVLWLDAARTVFADIRRGTKFPVP